MTDRSEQELGEAIRNATPATPPAEFQRELLQQMNAHLPQPRSHMRPWLIAASIAAACALTWGVAALLRQGPSSKPIAIVADGTTTAVSVSLPPEQASNAVDPASTGGAVAMRTRVLQAQLIARAKVDGVKDDIATYSITRVLHGQMDERLIQETPASPGLVPGRDVILFLEPRRDRQGNRIVMVTGVRYDNATNPIDNVERDIVAILRERNAGTPDLAGIPPQPPVAERRRAESSAMGILPPERNVSRATLILRTRVQSFDDSMNVTYAITRVIYGSFDEKNLTLDAGYGSPRVLQSFLERSRTAFQQQNGRDPTPQELSTQVMKDRGIEINREVILMLRPATPAAGVPPRYLMLSAAFSSPTNPLEPIEEEFVKIIRQGDYLEPIGPADVTQEILQGTDAVVRATLLEGTPTSARWRIEKTLRGTNLPLEVEIPHELLRRRAETYVRFVALGDERLRDPARQEARIREEIAAMVKEELATGREAVLFLANLRREGDRTLADITARAYDTSKRTTLQQIEDSLSPQQLNLPGVR